MIMAGRKDLQKRVGTDALSLFKDKLGNVKNRRAPVVRNNNQVGPTRTAKQKKDAIIDGDFTDITPKAGFTKKELALLITGGVGLGLAALNKATSSELKDLSADADADTKPKRGKGETAAEKAARLKKLREDQAKVNASNPGSPGNKVTTKTKATTTTAGKGKGKLFKKFRPFGGVIARALLGDDEKFGGERGMIDFIRTKKKKKPVKKNMGGMMKKKGYADGGDVGKKASLDGLSEKELKQMILRLKKESLKPKVKPKKTSPPKRSINLPQEKRSMNIPEEEERSFNFSKGGAAKKKGYAKGGMTKKGYANGGMAKKGYANGGSAKKTTAKKTASRGKARGVGAATRGYGRAMKK